LITSTNRFRCAIAQSPASGDWMTDLLLDSSGPFYATWSLVGATPWDHPAAYASLSMNYRLDRVHVPVMYAVGDMEPMGILVNALEMYQGLRLLHRPVTLVRYPGQGHGLEGWAARDFATRSRQFVDECLKRDTK